MQRKELLHLKCVSFNYNRLRNTLGLYWLKRRERRKKQRKNKNRLNGYTNRSCSLGHLGNTKIAFLFTSPHIQPTVRLPSFPIHMYTIIYIFTVGYHFFFSHFYTFYLCVFIYFFLFFRTLIVNALTIMCLSPRFRLWIIL